MVSIDVKEIENNEVLRNQLLKRDNYKCKVCGIRHKTRVYVNSGGDYVECDELIEEWAKANGRKVFSVGLSVISLTPFVDYINIVDLVLMCNVCRLKFDNSVKKKLRRRYRALVKAYKKNQYPKMDLIDYGDMAMLKYHFRSVYGVELLSTSLRLINKMLNNKIKENEQK